MFPYSIPTNAVVWKQYTVKPVYNDTVYKNKPAYNDILFGPREIPIFSTYFKPAYNDIHF